MNITPMSREEILNAISVLNNVVIANTYQGYPNLAAQSASKKILELIEKLD